MQIEQPPDLTDPSLINYLVRMFQRVDSALRITHIFSPRKVLPDKPKIGGVYYFEAAIPATSITGEGLWLYKSTGWIQIA